MNADPGLQRERTALSWQRTALSTSMIAVLLAFACLRTGFLIGTAIAGMIAVGAAVVLFAARRRAARSHGISPWTSLTRVAALLIGTAVVGAVLAVIVLF
ncbi:MAG: DUF202 domain-containing protein [Herbiconiux sp.]|nr:MAG: DUF202 domain-containing protein [Herbiconiux sp.]